MFRSFLPKANSQSPKKSKSIQANLFARLCIIYWYYFITFSQLFLVDGLFWTYWRLMYHVNGLALSFFFESGLNVHKLMNSLINNQLKRYWSKILIGITNDWTGNQSMIFSGFVSWHNFVGIKRGWLFRDQNDCDVTRSKLYPLKDCSRCSTHTLLFVLFCFILFIFFPAHFSLHRLLTIWTAR